MTKVVFTSEIQARIDAHIFRLEESPGLSHLISTCNKMNSTNARVGIVGGTVRDIFIGAKSKDIDLIVTGLSQEEIIETLELFGRVDAVGKSFGVIKFTDFDGEIIDIAIPRTETKTGDSHTSFDIVASKDIPIKQDLLRRDFTFNAIVLWSNGEVFDPFDGIGSIIRKRIEIVNDAAFIEDPLRILRAVQFAVRFDFVFHIKLEKLIKSHIWDIQNLPKERITEELRKCGKGTGNFNRAVTIMNDLGVSKVLFGENIEVGTLTIKTEFDWFFILSLAFNAITEDDINNVLTIGGNFAKVIAAFQAEKQDLILGLFQISDVTDTLASMKFISKILLIDKELVQTCSFWNKEAIDIMHTMINDIMPLSVNHLAVNGNDIMDAGFTGADIGHTQHALLNKVWNCEVENTSSALITLMNDSAFNNSILKNIKI